MSLVMSRRSKTSLVPSHVLNSVTPTPCRLRPYVNIQAQLEAIKLHSPFEAVANSTESL